MSIFFDSLTRLIVSLKKIIARENFSFSTFCDYEKSILFNSPLRLGQEFSFGWDGGRGPPFKRERCVSSARLARRRVISNE